MKFVLNKPIDMEEVLRDAKPHGIIHAGAYLGQWWKIYEKYGVKNRCWIEACPETFDKLSINVPQIDIKLNYAVCDRDEEMIFVVTSNMQSSSIFSLKIHLKVYPSIKPTKQIIVIGRRMDTLIDQGLIDISKYDFLLMDLQGAEYLALKGLEKNISKINYIVSEVNYMKLYDGSTLFNNFDKYISSLGFKKVIMTKFKEYGEGDVYYKRT